MNHQTPLTAGLGESRRGADDSAQTVWAGPWPGVVMALAVLALLLAFSHVVSQGVQQGELRRQAMARQASQLWRCDAAQQRLSGPCAAEFSPAAVPEATPLQPNPPSPDSIDNPYRQTDLQQPNR